VATINLRPDNLLIGVWWLVWTERNEVIGRIDGEPTGRCKIHPEGPHWSPMKSFDRTYVSLESALHEVRLYFERR
jgi:hypothetical protein